MNFGLRKLRRFVVKLIHRPSRREAVRAISAAILEWQSSSPGQDPVTAVIPSNEHLLGSGRAGICRAL
jgi:hypothetical protein